MADTVSHKSHFEAILTEKDRAIAMADRERELAAAALRNEQHRREDQATAERAAAAENLRVELARAIKEGDDRLREHIANQIAQIAAALVSADKLELERLGRAHDGLEALSVKLDVIREAAREAQDKFEATAERDKAKQNEFRAALDDLSQRMALRRDMEERDQALGARVDELQNQIGELRSRIDVGPQGLAAVQSRLDLSQGAQAGSRLTVASFVTVITVAVVVLGLVVTVANLLAN